MAKKAALAIVILLVLALIALDVLQSVALRNEAVAARAAAAAAAERIETLQKEIAAGRDQTAVLQSRLNERKDEITVLQSKVADLERQSRAGFQFPHLAPGAPIQIPLPGVQQRDVQDLLGIFGPDANAAVGEALKEAGATVNFNGGQMTIRILGGPDGVVVQPVPPPAPPLPQRQQPKQPPPPQPKDEQPPEKAPANF